MALTTASSKLRSTILFSSKEEQVFFKRSSADLAATRGSLPPRSWRDSPWSS